jgi:hypothetical protein
MGRRLLLIAIAGLLALTVAARRQDQARGDTHALSPGCTRVDAWVPASPLPAAIAAAVMPPSAVRAVWAQGMDGRLQAFFPADPAASDWHGAVASGAIWACVATSATLQSSVSSGTQPALHCTAALLPLGRAADSYAVSCLLQDAPASERAFAVAAFSFDGPPVCSGALLAGRGGCAGQLTITLDETPPPLRFFVRSEPGGLTAVDATPAIGPIPR